MRHALLCALDDAPVIIIALDDAHRLELQPLSPENYGSLCRLHQTTMVVEDPSCRAANVCCNVRPYRLTIMQSKFFRAYCTRPPSTPTSSVFG